jgi:phenylalanyl-tRNA synthetase alpha subunit
MDYRILELFIKENDAWEDMIRRQKMEMPVLDAMITNIVADKKGLKEERSRVYQYLHHEMQKAQHSMDELEKELMKQQQYLSSERKRKSSDPYSIDTFNSQTILRSRIKDVEKNFVELKCNYLNYVATI